MPQRSRSLLNLPALPHLRSKYFFAGVGAFIIIVVVLTGPSLYIPSTSKLSSALPFSISLGNTGRTCDEDIFNSTLGFGKIYAINLPERSDHRDAVTLSGALTDLHFAQVRLQCMTDRRFEIQATQWLEKVGCFGGIARGCAAAGDTRSPEADSLCDAFCARGWDRGDGKPVVILGDGAWGDVSSECEPTG